LLNLLSGPLAEGQGHVRYLHFTPHQFSGATASPNNRWLRMIPIRRTRSLQT